MFINFGFAPKKTRSKPWFRVRTKPQQAKRIAGCTQYRMTLCAAEIIRIDGIR